MMRKLRFKRQVVEFTGSGDTEGLKSEQYETTPSISLGSTNTTRSQAELDAIASTFGRAGDNELNESEITTFVPNGNNSIVNTSTTAPGFGSQGSEFTTLAPGFDRSSTSQLTTVGDNSEGQVMLLVGITCGVVGLLIGIIITVGIWLYCKRKNSGSVSRKRHGSKMERNPKEMTFEPLDLSLTLPSYEKNPIVKNRRSVSSYADQHQGPTKRHSAFNDLNLAQSASSYHGFDAPIPPSESYPTESSSYISYDTGPDIFEDTRRLPRDLNRSSDSYLPPLAPYHHFNSHTYRVARSSINSSSVSLENRKRPSSTRDSFSSGHGTGTDSDTLSYDPRRQQVTRYHEDIPSDLEFSYNEKTPHRRHNSHRSSRNNSKLGIVRESTLRRSKRSDSSSKMLQNQTPDDSSTCASTGSISIPDWNREEETQRQNELPPSSNVNNTNSVVLSQNKRPSIRKQTARTDGDSDWENSDDGGDNHPPVASKDEEDVLSTYFNMHFPPTPLRSQSVTKQHSLPLNTVGSFETPSHQLARQSSDVTIEL